MYRVVHYVMEHVLLLNYDYAFEGNQSGHCTVEKKEFVFFVMASRDFAEKTTLTISLYQRPNWRVINCNGLVVHITNTLKYFIFFVYFKFLTAAYFLKARCSLLVLEEPLNSNQSQLVGHLLLLVRSLLCTAAFVVIVLSSLQYHSCQSTVFPFFRFPLFFKQKQIATYLLVILRF